MPSQDSKLEPTAPCDEAQSSKPEEVEPSEPSPIDDHEFSGQTSDMFNACICNRPENFVTRNYTFDPMAIRRDLAKAIIMHDYPLSIINDRFFKRFLFDDFPPVSPSTLRSDILQVYELEKSRSMALFGDTKGRIAITVHKWVSCDQTKSFLAIAGHATHDEDYTWKVKARMIRFVSMPCSYTSEMLAKTIVDCLSQWEVTSKLSTIVVEDTSSESHPMLSDILLDKLSGTPLLLGGKFVQTKCFARVVGLMVQDAFAVVQTTIDKIRTIILFWSETPQRETQFKEASRELGIPFTSDNKLKLDSVSKWNTTFLMLQTALSYKPVFCHLNKLESVCVPSEEEWELLEEICEKLELLYERMQHVSEHNTANFGLRQIRVIKLALSSWIMSDNVKIKEMAMAMQEKFDKYFVSVRDIFAVAAVLDPRLKLAFIKFVFPQIYKDEVEAETEIEHIRKICSDLFDKYLSVEDLRDENSPSVLSLETDSWDTKLDKDYLREKRKRKREELEKYDINAYMKDKREPYIGDSDGFSCGTYFGKYDSVKNMARDIVAIPICCVPPENMFDVGDSVLSSHRSKLSPEMVEALMCSQSCLWTSVKGSYSITNSYSWGTSCDYDAVEHCAAEEGDKLVKS